MNQRTQETLNVTKTLRLGNDCVISVTNKPDYNHTVWGSHITAFNPGRGGANSVNPSQSKAAISFMKVRNRFAGTFINVTDNWSISFEDSSPVPFKFTTLNLRTKSIKYTREIPANDEWDYIIINSISYRFGYSDTVALIPEINADGVKIDTPSTSVSTFDPIDQTTNYYEGPIIVVWSDSSRVKYVRQPYHSSVDIFFRNIQTDPAGVYEYNLGAYRHFYNNVDFNNNYCILPDRIKGSGGVCPTGFNPQNSYYCIERNGWMVPGFITPIATDNIGRELFNFNIFKKEVPVSQNEWFGDTWSVEGYNASSRSDNFGKPIGCNFLSMKYLFPGEQFGNTIPQTPTGDWKDKVNCSSTIRWPSSMQRGGDRLFGWGIRADDYGSTMVAHPMRSFAPCNGRIIFKDTYLKIYYPIDERVVVTNLIAGNETTPLPPEVEIPPVDPNPDQGGTNPPEGVGPDEPNIPSLPDNPDIPVMTESVKW